MAVALPGTAAAPPQERIELDCGFRGLDFWRSAIREGIERREIADPRTRALPELPPPMPQPQASGGSRR